MNKSISSIMLASLALAVISCSKKEEKLEVPNSDKKRKEYEAMHDEEATKKAEEAFQKRRAEEKAKRDKMLESL